MNKDIPLSSMGIIVPFTDLLVRIEVFPDRDVNIAFHEIRVFYKGDEQEKIVEKLINTLMELRNDS